MSFLLDTPIIYEVIRSEPSPTIKKWLEETPDTAIHLSVLTIGEITQSVGKLADKTEQGKIRLWLKHDLVDWLGNRIINIDDVTATIWGNMINLELEGLSSIDLLLAATAIKHDLNLTTCNANFEKIEALTVVNPTHAIAANGSTV